MNPSRRSRGPQFSGNYAARARCVSHLRFARIRGRPGISRAVEMARMHSRPTMRRTTLLRQVCVVFGAVLVICCQHTRQSTPGKGSADPTSEDVACIAPFIIRACATSGCHDALTKQNGLDLSNGKDIYESIVNRNGLDRCNNALRVRVVPGSPESSYLMDKVTGKLACVGIFSRAMPPPPDAPLSSSEIAVLREWITRGASRDCRVGDFGAGGAGPTAGGGSSGMSSGGMSASGNGGAGSGGDAADASAPLDDPFECTPNKPCEPNSICLSGDCAYTGSCIPHSMFYPQSSDDPQTFLLHPCPMQMVPYCDCNGVTFQARDTCADRPFVHRGACGDGYSCDKYRVHCDTPRPACPTSQTSAVVDGCFGACIPVGQCRCEYSFNCPEGYTCDLTTSSCVVAPPDGGAP